LGNPETHSPALQIGRGRAVSASGKGRQGMTVGKDARSENARARRPHLPSTTGTPTIARSYPCRGLVRCRNPSPFRKGGISGSGQTFPRPCLTVVCRTQFPGPMQLSADAPELTGGVRCAPRRAEPLCKPQGRTSWMTHSSFSGVGLASRWP
jgi:hypothetical protein